MRPDLPYIKAKFKEYNDAFFGGELPELPIRLSNARTTLGCFVRPRNYPSSLERGVGECHIRISVRLDYPELEVENTIIHEMIHYWIWFKRIKDSSAHGPHFRAKMTEINRLSGRDIGISHRTTKEEAASDLTHRNNYICVTEWKDGTVGLTLVPRTRIFDFNRLAEADERLVSLRWFWSQDLWFNNYPVSRAFKVFFPTNKEELELHLKKATPCECKNGRFYPKNARR